MTDQNTTADKRIVAELSFGAKTAKRVEWEAWEFEITGPHQVEVTNASYGVEKEDHAYTVGIEKRGGLPVPAECNCPADIHRDPDCKHKVALATVGGPVVLNAAVDFENAAAGLSGSTPDGITTAAHKLQTDGGMTPSGDGPDACPNGDGRCDGPHGEALPCFDCFEVNR